MEGRDGAHTDLCGLSLSLHLCGALVDLYGFPHGHRATRSLVTNTEGLCGYVSGVLMHNLCTLIDHPRTVNPVGPSVCPLLWIASFDVRTVNLMPILLDNTF